MSEQIRDAQEEENSIEIMGASLGDEKDIAEVQHQTWLETYPNKEAGITREDLEAKGFDSVEKTKKWREAIEGQNESKQIYVAKENGRVIGFCVAGRKEDMDEIHAIYLLPNHHGKGVGRKLMEEALNWLGSEKKICLWVAAYNMKTIEFYKRFGFKESGKTSSLPIANGKEMGIIEMIKE
jgi:GNAT superfamily N-acetyltransferase